MVNNSMAGNILKTVSCDMRYLGTYAPCYIQMEFA